MLASLFYKQPSGVKLARKLHKERFRSSFRVNVENQDDSDLQHRPFNFAKDISSAVFEPVILQEYYDSGMRRVLSEFSNSLLYAYDLSSFYNFPNISLKKQLTDILSWDISFFEHIKRKTQKRQLTKSSFKKKNKIYEQKKDFANFYVHQLQVSSTAGAYMHSVEGLTSEDKLVALIASITHDTPEDGFILVPGYVHTPGEKIEDSNKVKVTCDDLEQKIINATNSEKIASRVVNIVKHLTRLDANGGEIEYREAAAQIALIDNELDRSIGYIIKMADRINNMRTLGDLSKKKIKWRIKNLYKTEVLLTEVKNQIDSDNLYAPLALVLKSMFNDLSELASHESRIEERFFQDRSRKYAHKTFNSEDTEENQAYIPLWQEVRECKIDLFPIAPEQDEENIQIPEEKYRNLQYPKAYKLVAGKRQVQSLFDKMGQMVDVYVWHKSGTYNNPENKKVRAARDAQELALIHDLEGNPELSWIFDEFDDHFETMITDTNSGALKVEDFYAGVTTGWCHLYNTKSHFKYEVHKNRSGSSPKNPTLLLDNLTRPSSDADCALPEQEQSPPKFYRSKVNNPAYMKRKLQQTPEVLPIVKDLFGYAHSHMLRSRIQKLGTYDV